MRQNKIAIPYPWPGMKLGAELELIRRIQQAAEEENMECVVMDNSGYLLDDNLNSIGHMVQEEEIAFVLSLHFLTFKSLDAFYYCAIWNPPEIPLDSDDYGHFVDNYTMCDDYLIYDHGVMSNHLKSILWGKQRTLTDCSQLMGTFPKSAIIRPDLDKPQLFYCGINWDVLVHGRGRNESVMKLLDDAGIICIYGPDKAWGGIRPWAGYRCYQGEIPFDGFSILQHLHKCGVCLVLSSDVHRRAGAVTNRAFEACAAGAVMISDDNPLMKEMFGGAALFIEYNKSNPRDTANQIIEKYEWICSHKDEAQQIAENAQKIFRERYTLNHYLKEILKKHEGRLSVYKSDLFARNERQRVAVFYVCDSIKPDQLKNELQIICTNIGRQVYKNIILVVAVDVQLGTEVVQIIEKQQIECRVVPMLLHDKNGVRRISNGQAIEKLRGLEPHNAFMFMTPDEHWFSDHVTTLLRTLEDNPEAWGANSGQLYRGGDGHCWVNLFGKIEEIEVCNQAQNENTVRLAAGALLLRSRVHGELPEFVFDMLDGKEYIAYVNVLLEKDRRNLVFSRRMTLIENYRKKYHCNTVIKRIHENRFLQELTRYDHQSANKSSVSKSNVLCWVTELPIKTYCRIRICRVLLRIVHIKKFRQWLEKKYHQLFEQYLGDL